MVNFNEISIHGTQMEGLQLIRYMPELQGLVFICFENVDRKALFI